MVDFGTAIACLTGLPARFTFVAGPLNLAYALARRLITPRGRLDYDPDYGTDIRDYLNHANTPQGQFAIQSAVAAECAKDERVLAVTADVSFNALLNTLTITVSAQTANGPFRAVLGVDKETVNVLEAA